MCRYAKFLLLRKHHLELQHPIPPLDIALLWSSHMSASGMYAADCQQLLQRPFLDLPGGSESVFQGLRFRLDLTLYPRHKPHLLGPGRVGGRGQ